MENRILQREESLDHRTDALEKREHQLSSLQGQLDRRKNDLDSLVSQQSQELERIAALTKMRLMMSFWLESVLKVFAMRL